MKRIVGTGVLVLLAAGCAAPPVDPVAGPAVVVLGTAQDGGLPHVACSCVRCERARTDPAARRLVASLLIETTDPPRRYLIDASPDLPEQLETFLAADPGGKVQRRPVDGILLTHAHMGHYLGLAWLGFEAMHAPGIPVHASERFCTFLAGNAPWDQLVRLGNVVPLPFDEVIELEGGIRVVPVAVPHRDEYTDTVAFLIEGPRHSVFYAPDTDGWQHWQPPIEDWLRRADVALLDGTFYSLDELPGRAVESVGHPLIDGSVDRFAAADDLRARIYFTHFNHSNPIVEDGPELARVRAAGFQRAEDGARFPL